MAMDYTLAHNTNIASTANVCVISIKKCIQVRGSVVKVNLNPHNQTASQIETGRKKEERRTENNKRDTNRIKPWDKHEFTILAA